MNELTAGQIKMLAGQLQYPVKKNDFIVYLSKHAIPPDILAVVRKIPDIDYENPDKLCTAIDEAAGSTILAEPI